MRFVRSCEYVCFQCSCYHLLSFSSLTCAWRVSLQSEGIAGLWTGVSPAVQRAFIVNAAELATYDQAKGMLVGTGYFQPTDVKTHFAASFLAGFFSALASS